MLQPFRFVGACATFVAIGLFILYWFLSDEGVRPNIDSRLNNVAPETSKAERYNASTERRPINKVDRGVTEAERRRISLPDGLILGMSRSELDAFHKRQMFDISEQLSNPQAEVELPPSDDILPSMTLRELNALHKQQTIALKNKDIEIVLLEGGGTKEARTSVMTLEELDLIHKEQSSHARSDSQLMELPSVFSENEFQTLTLDLLDKVHSRQQLAADFNQVDDTNPIVLPPSDDGPHTMTNWDLIELHAQQEELSTK